MFFYGSMNRQLLIFRLNPALCLKPKSFIELIQGRGILSGKEKKYQISPSLIDGILEIIVTGEITAGNFEIFQHEVIAVIQSDDVKDVLIDVRALKGYSGIIETYLRVKTYPPYMYAIQIAVVHIPENFDSASYHDNTGINAGLKLQRFTDIDAALTWLKRR
jgi:hypothetical protein